MIMPAKYRIEIARYPNGDVTYKPQEYMGGDFDWCSIGGTYLKEDDAINKIFDHIKDKLSAVENKPEIEYKNVI